MSFMRKSPKRAVVCLSIFASTIALAAADEENSASAFAECAALQDDAERLACFDKVAFRPQPTPVLSEPAEIRQPEAAAPTAEAARPDAPKAEPTTQSIDATLPDEPTVAPALSPVEEFGMNATVAAQSGNSGRPEKLTEISATVTHVRKRAYGELVVTLENGQVWTEKESEYGFRIKQGDTITIRQGRLGGYRMIGRGNRSSQVVRVE